MTSVCREIFKAIHEGKWLSIEYKNQTGKITKYWIGIKSLNLRDLSLIVDGLHLGELKVQQLKIFIKSILNAAIVEGSYCEVNRKLVEDIKLNPTISRGNLLLIGKHFPRQEIRSKRHPANSLFLCDDNA